MDINRVDNEVVGLRGDLVDKIVDLVMERIADERLIPVEFSARHVHLSSQHMIEMFGEDRELTKRKDLSQPGQFQYDEKVTLIGPRGVIKGVSILGPPRGRTQVEVSKTDAVLLGIDPPVRESGKLEGSETLFIASDNSVIKADESVIVAKRHIHMTPKNAEEFGVVDKQIVRVEILSSRPLIFSDVVVRVSRSYSLNMHIDFDEANAAGCTPTTVCRICL